MAPSNALNKRKTAHLKVARLFRRRRTITRAGMLQLTRDQKLFTILTSNPTRRFAAAGPCAAAFRVTIFRGDASTRTAHFRILTTAAAQLGERNAVVGHLLLDLVQHFCVFA